MDVSAIFSETDLELMKQILKKAWLEDFYQFCVSCGGTTEETMGHVLKTEADQRVLLVTLNALNTPLGTAQQLQDRNALYPHFGYLYPEGSEKNPQGLERNYRPCSFRTVWKISRIV